MSDERWLNKDRALRALELVKASSAHRHGDLYFTWREACDQAIDAVRRLAAAPSPPVSVEQAGKATRAQIEAAFTSCAVNKYYVPRSVLEAAINAALQLSISPSLSPPQGEGSQ